MIKRFLKIILSFLCGIAAGFIINLFISENNKDHMKDVAVTQISGEKIAHDTFDYRQSDRITFFTESDGKGRIFTEIPKIKIPEARAWMEKRNSIQGGIIWFRGPVYSISYWRRWESFTLGAGIVASEEGAGIQAGAGYWW